MASPHLLGSASGAPILHKLILGNLMQILETQGELYFHLQQQRLIELIRKGKTEEALQFAEENLAVHGEENPKLLEELGEAQGMS